MSRVRLSDLKLGPELGAGSFGKVYSLASPTPAVAWAGEVVCKQYKKAAGSVSSGALLQIVRARERLGQADRAVVDEGSVWPLAVVIDDLDRGLARGLLMPRIGADFHFQSAGTGARKLCDFQFLMASPTKCRRIGVPLATVHQRFQLGCDLASVFAALHRNDLVFGDLSPTNVVFRLSPVPRVLLLDCDAVRVAGSAPVLPQVPSAGWEPPEGTDQATIRTDRYKLALMVLRILVPGNFASCNTRPRSAEALLDRRGMTLLRSGIEGTPGDRPSAEDWTRYLGDPEALRAAEANGDSSAAVKSARHDRKQTAPMAPVPGTIPANPWAWMPTGPNVPFPTIAGQSYSPGPAPAAALPPPAPSLTPPAQVASVSVAPTSGTLPRPAGPIAALCLLSLLAVAIGMWEVFVADPGQRGPSAQSTTVQEERVVDVQDRGSILWVRSGPSLAAARVGQLLHGARIEVLERTNGWLRIRSYSASGWVSEAFTRSANSTPARPAAPPSTAQLAIPRPGGSPSPIRPVATKPPMDAADEGERALRRARQLFSQAEYDAALRECAIARRLGARASVVDELEGRLRRTMEALGQ